MQTIQGPNGDIQIVINVAALERVANRVHDENGKPFDLYRVGAELCDPKARFETLMQLAEDRRRLALVVGAILDDQPLANQFDGDQLDAALDAIVESVISFFPRSRRDGLRAVYRRLIDVGTQAIEMITEKLNGPEMDEQMQSALKTFGESLGRSPDGSESTPALSPSDS